jgi:hypothetical protein
MKPSNFLAATACSEIRDRDKLRARSSHFPTSLVVISYPISLVMNWCSFPSNLGAAYVYTSDGAGLLL